MNVIKTGKPYPLGCSKQIENGIVGCNFALFSSVAAKVELCLFDSKGNEKKFELTSNDEGVWHIWLSDVPVGTEYGLSNFRKI